MGQIPTVSQQIFDMKLLPLACFAASAAQSGDYDYSDVEKGYGFDGDANYDDYGNKKKNKYSSGGYGGSYDGSYGGSSYGGTPMETPIMAGRQHLILTLVR